MKSHSLLFLSLAILSACNVVENQIDKIKGSSSSSTTSSSSSSSSDSSNNQVSISGTTKKYIARTKVKLDSFSLGQIANQAGISIKNHFKVFNGFTFQANSSAQVQALLASGHIIDVQEDVQMKIHLNTAVKQIGADKVQNVGVNGSGTKVCIIDTGMNDHTNLPSPVAEHDFVHNDGTADDENGHGTMVAGIVASNHSATLLSYKGVAPGSQLLIAKVFDASGTGSSSLVVSAMDWCADNGAEVISMSLGHGGFTSHCDTDYSALFANSMVDMGIVVVAASGNDGYTNKISAPACGSKVISVGSVSKTDAHSSFSNGASFLSVVAPGENITTTNYKNNTFTTFSGTSAATPFIAGVASLLKSMSDNPSAAEIKAAIINTTKDLGTKGKDAVYGYGRVDAYAAYNFVLSGGVPTAPLTFDISSPALIGSVSGSMFKESQNSFQVDCPVDHYMSDLEIQKSTWMVYPSVTWFKYHCQAMKSLNTSTELGKKRYEGDTNVKKDLCGDKQAITGMEVTYDFHIKDFRIQCAEVNYHAAFAGSVYLDNRTLTSANIFGRGDFNDDVELLECPEGEVVVGFEGNTKADGNEWAITKFGVRCSPIQTKYE